MSALLHLRRRPPLILDSMPTGGVSLKSLLGLLHDPLDGLAPKRLAHDTGLRNTAVRGQTGHSRRHQSRYEPKLTASYTPSRRYFASRLMSRTTLAQSRVQMFAT